MRFHVSDKKLDNHTTENYFPMIWVGFAAGSGSISSIVSRIRIWQNETDPGGSGSGSETLIQKTS